VYVWQRRKATARHKRNEAKREQRFPGIKIPDKQGSARQNNPDSQVKKTKSGKT
jgi:hypothetical protein